MDPLVPPGQWGGRSFSFLLVGGDAGWGLDCSLLALSTIVHAQAPSEGWRGVSHASIFSVEGKDLVMVSGGVGQGPGVLCALSSHSCLCNEQFWSVYKEASP